MILLGITGPIGHGKTTLAGFLADQDAMAYQTESSEIITEVADRLNKFFFWEAPTELDLNSINRWLAHLPAIVESVTHAHIHPDKLILQEHMIDSAPEDYEKLWEYVNEARHNQKLLTEHISANNKGAYRPLLQWLGGYLVKHVDEGIWFNELIRRARLAETYDCRLFIIGGVRFPSDGRAVRAAGGKILRINRPGAIELDKSDPTERERTNILVDSTILNNASLEDLQACAMQVYSDMEGGRLKRTYKARSA